MKEESNSRETPEISIITVGMNHYKYLQKLLQSLFVDHKPNVSFELIYVDNCSSDSSVDFIKENYKSVRVICNDTPLGFGENNNKGAQYASGKYIAIINPDIIFQPNSLDNLFEYAKTLSEVIIAPQLINPDNTLQLSVRKYMNPLIFIMRLLTKGNDNSKNKIIKNYLCAEIDPNKTQPIDWAIGAALFMPKSLFDKLKGFDVDFFLYFEDVDLCLRSWKINAPVIYFPQSKMIHNHLRDSAKVNKKTLMHFKSMMIFFKKHGIFLKSHKS